jgi:hypothetical protein
MTVRRSGIVSIRTAWHGPGASDGADDGRPVGT